MEGQRVAGRLLRVRSRRRRRLRSHRLVATVILISFFGIGGAAGVAYMSIKPRVDELQANLTAKFQAGQQELEAGRDALKAANGKHDPKLVNQAVAHFAAAKSEFLAAKDIADRSSLLRYSESVPAVGEFAHSRHLAVVGIAQMGAALSDVGQDLSDIDGQFLRSTAKNEAGRSLLNLIDEARPRLPQVRSDLVRAQKSASQVDARVLPTGQQVSFEKARDSIAAALAGLDEFDRLVPVLTEVLGGNGMRTYLVEQVNPAELRAGGGFIGTYSLLQADHGTLKLVRTGNSYDLAEPRPKPGQPGFIPLPGPYRELGQQTSWSFVDSNEFPDFVSNAQAAEAFVQPRIGKIDGVVSIDYYAVAKMLELSGPLKVPGYGLTVSGQSFVAQIVAQELADEGEHKAILKALSGPLMTSIVSLPPDRWQSLIEALNGLAQERHLQAYFNNASVQDEIGRIGWSGRINSLTVEDYMMEIESNYGGGKSNYFLARHYAVDLTRRGNVLHHKITIDFTNSMPQVKGTFGIYRATVRLYTSPDATSTSSNLKPVSYEYTSPPTGNALLAGWLPIVNCCGGRGQVVMEYDTPWQTGGKGVHEVYWQKQPGTLNDKIDVTWSNGDDRTYKVSGDLSQDRLISLSAAGATLTVGQAAEAALRTLGF